MAAQSLAKVRQRVDAAPVPWARGYYRPDGWDKSYGSKVLEHASEHRDALWRSCDLQLVGLAPDDTCVRSLGSAAGGRFFRSMIGLATSGSGSFYLLNHYGPGRRHIDVMTARRGLTTRGYHARTRAWSLVEHHRRQGRFSAASGADALAAFTAPRGADPAPTDWHAVTLRLDDFEVPAVMASDDADWAAVIELRRTTVMIGAHDAAPESLRLATITDLEPYGLWPDIPDA